MKGGVAGRAGARCLKYVGDEEVACQDSSALLNHDIGQIECLAKIEGIPAWGDHP